MRLTCNFFRFHTRLLNHDPFYSIPNLFLIHCHSLLAQFLGNVIAHFPNAPKLARIPIVNLNSEFLFQSHHYFDDFQFRSRSWQPFKVR